MLHLKNQRVNGMLNPIGITITKPIITWSFEQEEDLLQQKAFQIIVYEEDYIVHDSEWIERNQQYYVLPESLCQSRKQYSWSMRVKDSNDEESPWCERHVLEFGLFEETDWQAKWIEPEQKDAFKHKGFTDDRSRTPAVCMPIDEENLRPSPYLRKEIQLLKPIQKARVYATAHGCYQMSLNGKRIGDYEMMPEMTPYDRMLQVQTYDMTDLLIQGNNVWGIVLSDGWWCGHVSLFGNTCYYGNRLAFLGQMEIAYEDGTVEIIGSDASFVSSEGEIRYADLGIGEKVDRRLYVEGWNEAKEIAGTWYPVKEMDYGYHNLCGQNAEPLRILKRCKPDTVIKVEPNVFLIDFGQIMTGNCSIVFDGTDRRGETITIFYCEQVASDGSFQQSFNGYRQHQDTFILRGEKQEIYEPTFTFRGFRWVQVKGYTGQVYFNDCEARLIASDVTPLTTFECSNRYFTKLHQNINWTYQSNLFSVPMDNPDRERAGWTGDFEMICATAFRFFDLRQFTKRWMEEHRLSQKEDGSLPLTIPDHLPFETRACAGWGDDCIIVPWKYYLAYGDISILEENYEMMVRWMDYVKGRLKLGVAEKEEFTTESPFIANMDMSIYKNYSETMDERHRENFQYIWTSDFQFGDWMTPSGSIDENGKWHYRSTDNNTTFFVNYYTVYVSGLLRNVAEVLGKKEDVKKYETLHQRIRQAVIEELYETGYIQQSNSQGVLVLSLKAQLYPEGKKEELLHQLLRVIEKDKHINTGFSSLEYIFKILAVNGHEDVAYDLLFDEEAPSYLYMMKHDMTGMWETWFNIQSDGTTNTASYIQPALGTVGSWFFEGILGIRCLEPGYQKILIQPIFDKKKRITHAKGSIEIPQGTLKVSWRIEDEKRVLDVEVPPNTSVSVFTNHLEEMDTASKRFVWEE